MGSNTVSYLFLGPFNNDYCMEKKKKTYRLVLSANGKLELNKHTLTRLPA